MAELYPGPGVARRRRRWQLRGRLSAYDAMYVALAEERQVPLVTLDDRLAGTRGHRAVIIRY